MMNKLPKRPDSSRYNISPNRGQEAPGLYIHIPFCKSKCIYCDFYSIPAPDLISDYVQAVILEAAHYADRFSAFDTLYFGGGTPSVLSHNQAADLLAGLRNHVRISPNSEITLEANPDDLSPDYLAALRDLGINRLSLGIQSFDDADLRFLKRRHSAGRAREAIQWAREAGFKNLSLDLMYALPGQTLEKWLHNLDTALEFEPEHLSCYQLTIEPHTPLGQMLERGEFQAADEEAARDFFLTTSEFLERNGYLHYEVSNFARAESLKSRHNSKYWRHVPYLGLGPSAHSFLNDVRWWNAANVESYCDDLLKKNRMPVEEEEALTPDQLRLERLYLGFRTKEGVPLELLDLNAPGSRNRETLKGLVESGHLRLEGGHARPTREGLLIADSLPLMFDT